MRRADLEDMVLTIAYVVSGAACALATAPADAGLGTLSMLWAGWLLLLLLPFGVIAGVVMGILDIVLDHRRYRRRP